MLWLAYIINTVFLPFFISMGILSMKYFSLFPVYKKGSYMFVYVYICSYCGIIHTGKGSKI